MTCAAIMTAKPPKVSGSDSVAAAARALIGRRADALPVVDSEGCFIGMFGVHDLLALIVPRVALAGDLRPNLRFVGDDPGELRKKFAAVGKKHVSECCDRHAVTLHPETPAIEAIRLVCRGQVTLAVVERNTRKLVGIVSSWDAIRAVSAAAPIP